MNYRLPSYAALLLSLPIFLAACQPGMSNATVSVNGKTLSESDLKTIVPKKYEKLREWYKKQPGELEKWYKEQKDRLPKVYAQNVTGLLKEAAQTQMIELEAKSKGMTPQQFMKAEMQKVGLPSKADIERKYVELRSSGLTGGKPLSALKDRIQQQLYVEAREAAQNEMMFRLTRKYKFSYAHTFETKDSVSAGDDPFQGGSDAKITIVEYTDFKCGYCARARGTSREIIKQYGDKIKWVIKDSPFQRGSMQVHQAVNCMNKVNQKAYWKYFEALFSPFRDRNTLQEPGLTNIAVKLGANRSKFQACMKDPAIAQEIQGDLKEGKQLGVKGTPAFFVNGVFVDGARPFMDFVNVIESQLN